MHTDLERCSTIETTKISQQTRDGKQFCEEDIYLACASCVRTTTIAAAGDETCVCRLGCVCFDVFLLLNETRRARDLVSSVVGVRSSSPCVGSVLARAQVCVCVRVSVRRDSSVIYSPTNKNVFGNTKKKTENFIQTIFGRHFSETSFHIENSHKLQKKLFFHSTH